MNSIPGYGNSDPYYTAPIYRDIDVIEPDEPKFLMDGKLCEFPGPFGNSKAMRQRFLQMLGSTHKVKLIEVKEPTLWVEGERTTFFPAPYGDSPEGRKSFAKMMRTETVVNDIFHPSRRQAGSSFQSNQPRSFLSRKYSLIGREFRIKDLTPLIAFIFLLTLGYQAAMRINLSKIFL